MKKIYYIIFILFFYFSFAAAKITNVLSLNNVDLVSAKCDFVVRDKGYYDSIHNQYKFLWFKWKNKSSKKVYFWGVKEKILDWQDLVELNLSVVKKEENWKGKIFTGLLIPNYSILCKQWFAIEPWQEIRLLSTAEENKKVVCGNINYFSKFTKNWFLKEWVFVDGSYYMIPIIRIIGHWQDVNSSKFNFKFALLFDYDNNLSTKSDNFVLVWCYNLTIWRCGDWKVDSQFWEECDPNDYNDSKYCYSNCKYTLQSNLGDKDRDWISDDEDVDPNVPEDFDWIQDGDGIPDDVCFWQSCFPKWSVKTLCNTCPCPMADYKWDLWYWDKIRATLWDKEWKILQSISKEKILNR